MIFFLPVVNTDSYIYINDNYQNSNSEDVKSIRKNRHIDPDCSEITGGIDLNRNYGYKFGIDDIGSSNDPCS